MSEESVSRLCQVLTKNLILILKKISSLYNIIFSWSVFGKDQSLLSSKFYWIKLRITKEMLAFFFFRDYSLCRPKGFAHIVIENILIYICLPSDIEKTKKPKLKQQKTVSQPFQQQKPCWENKQQ